MRFYHVTSGDRKADILRHGLQPRSERRGVFSDSPEERIYLFGDLATAEDAITNWLGDELPEEEDIVILEVEYDGPAQEDPELAGAFFVRRPIPPAQIRVVAEEAPDLPTLKRRLLR